MKVGDAIRVKPNHCTVYELYKGARGVITSCYESADHVVADVEVNGRIYFGRIFFKNSVEVIGDQEDVLPDQDDDDGSGKVTEWTEKAEANKYD